MSFSYRPELAKAIAVTLTESGHEETVYDITTPDHAVFLEDLRRQIESWGDGNARFR